jgi:hypothetical protein
MPEGRAQAHGCLAHVPNPKTVLPLFFAPFLQVVQFCFSHLTWLTLLAFVNAQTFICWHLSTHAIQGPLDS